MPIIVIFKLDGMDGSVSKDNVISMIENGNSIETFNPMNFRINHEIDGVKYRYDCPIVGFNRNNSNISNIYSFIIGITLDSPIKDEMYTKRNLILTYESKRIIELSFCPDSRTYCKDFNFYCVFSQLNSDLSLDKFIFLEVISFSFLAFCQRNRFFTFNKYNLETNSYSDEESIVYLSCSEENFDKFLKQMMELPEYSTLKHVKFSNVLFEIEN